MVISGRLIVHAPVQGVVALVGTADSYVQKSLDEASEIAGCTIVPPAACRLRLLSATTEPAAEASGDAVELPATPPAVPEWVDSEDEEPEPEPESEPDLETQAEQDSQLKSGGADDEEMDPSSEPEEIDMSKWKFTEHIFSGSYTMATLGEKLEEEGAISAAIEKVKADPQQYVALMYQTEMASWPEEQQKYSLICRAGTAGFKPTGCEPDGWMTCLLIEYQRLPPLQEVGGDEAMQIVADQYTDGFSYAGMALHSDDNPPICPGRGQGVGDVPSLKLIGDIDPNDVKQGSVGDCWLLSAISALAEFDGAVTRLFSHTSEIAERPTDQPNSYTVTLYNLATWEPEHIVVDERLAAKPDGSGLLGCAPSDDGELWVCYLEKAVAAHCGGWDKIDGGQCTHAWSLLTGCKDQYTINQQGEGADSTYSCYGKFNPNEQEWEEHANSPHDGSGSLWGMPWPEVGGGGDASLSLTRDELFVRMCAWDACNFILGAGTKAGSDTESTDGIVDGHAYTVLTCVAGVAGTDFDLIKVRNPWGTGEFESGMWCDDGSGWVEYPQVAAQLKPTTADDGIFWVTKEEFFTYFPTVYLSASDMTAFLED